jgi:hypothetical protein
MSVGLFAAETLRCIRRCCSDSAATGAGRRECSETSASCFDKRSIRWTTASVRSSDTRRPPWTHSPWRSTSTIRPPSATANPASVVCPTKVVKIAVEHHHTIGRRLKEWLYPAAALFHRWLFGGVPPSTDTGESGRPLPVTGRRLIPLGLSVRRHGLMVATTSGAVDHPYAGREFGTRSVDRDDASIRSCHPSVHKPLPFFLGNRSRRVQVIILLPLARSHPFIGRSETGLPAAPGRAALAPPAASPLKRASRLE